MIFAARRFAQAVVVLLVVSLVVFALVHLAPGGPLAIYLENPSVRPEDIARLRHSLGLDRPLPLQYLAWLRGVVVGDWGYSLVDGRPVVARIFERLPATLELVTVAVAFAAPLALAVGVLAALRPSGWFDRLTSYVSMAGISLPVFWIALLAQLVFALRLGWLPSAGRSSLFDDSFADRLRHLVLPATVLALLHASNWSRYVRSSMMTALGERYVLAATGKGAARRRVILRHVLRNALLPVVTIVLVDLAVLLSGAVMTESVFAWPGLGGLFTESLAKRDYSVLMAFVMLAATAVTLLNAFADVVYRIADPRTR